MSNTLQSVLTSKGQLTLPVQIRKKLNLTAGNKIAFVENADGSYTLAPVTRPVAALEGMLSSPERKPVTLEEMNAAIESASEA